MLYITTKDIVLKGYYTECIDDCCPSIGSYTRDIDVFVPAGTGIELRADGSVESVDIDREYGMSLYGSTLTITEKVLPLYEGEIKPISNEEYLRIKENEERLRDAYKDLDRLNCQYEFMVEDMDELNQSGRILSEEEYKRMSEQLWHNASQFVKQMATIASLRVQGGREKIVC